MVILLSGCTDVVLPENTNKYELERQKNVSAQKAIDELQKENEIYSQKEDTAEDNEQAEQIQEQLSAYYAYRTLNEQEQKLYRQLLYAMTKMEHDVNALTLDENVLNKVFHCVMNDHPELFFVSGYQYTRYTVGDVLTKLVFCATYNMDKSQVSEMQFQIADYVEKCFAQMPQYIDEYDKVKYLYEYIINNTEYDLEAENNQNICSVFLTGRSVCQGYAKAIQYLLQKQNIESLMVTGYANQDSHAWNLVKINGAYYYMDVTWGDASYTFENGDYMDKRAPINYDYFLVTTEELETTHVIDEEIQLPVCTETKDNYYIREGMYFDSYDEEKLRQIFDSVILANQEYVTIKCDSHEIYELMKKKLIDNQQIFQFFGQSWNSIAYVENEEQRTISFWF